MSEDAEKKLTLVQRYKRMAEHKRQRAWLLAYLEEFDADFRFEIAVLGLREVINRYKVSELWHLHNSHESKLGGVGSVGGASSVFGAGGGGGSGSYGFTVPQGVSQVQITAIGGGGSGGGQQIMTISPKHYTIKTP